MVSKSRCKSASSSICWSCISSEHRLVEVTSVLDLLACGLVLDLLACGLLHLLCLCHRNLMQLVQELLHVLACGIQFNPLNHVLQLVQELTAQQHG